MTKRASLKLVPCAIGAAVMGVFVFVAGCSREEQKPAPAASPMADPAFRQKLSEQRRERGDLAKTRSVVVEKMQAMVEAKKKELGTTDEAKVKAALEKDPEWNALYKKCVDANTAIDENRLRTTAVVREGLKAAAGTVDRKVPPKKNPAKAK